MLIRAAPDLRDCDVTEKSLYIARRHLIASVGAAALIGCAEEEAVAAPLTARKSPLSTAGEKQTAKEAITGYNNFYEFGTGKEDPARNARSFQTRPWTVAVEGAVGKPAQFGIDDLLKRFPLEERIYRLRCVEGWSMVIPWIGFPLASLLRAVEPTADGRYVAFETLNDPRRMPGQRDNVLRWPYREGLRLDEAMNPLTLLAVGLYGETLPNQNGAPIRLVVPWKYGFKSIKSIVRIRLQQNVPQTSWNMMQPSEYGFYSNVNPEVDHPRWSQRNERRIGEFLRRPTLMFNGYGEQVASLYRGMDLRRNF